MLLSPIALFTFNRPEHLARTLTALSNNKLAKKSALTIFCDAPRNTEEKHATNEVRTLAHSAESFSSVKVIERKTNLGCAKSIITGLTEMFTEHERLIVMEDDILCSPHTLTYLNAGLEKYENSKAIWNISAWSPPKEIFPIPLEYPYDVYAIPRFNCWGWASWRDRFDLVDWDVPDYSVFKRNTFLIQAFNQGGEDLTPMLSSQMQHKINSWAIRMDYARFKHGCVGIGPVKSYTTNIGMGSGTHCTTVTTRFDNDIAKAQSVVSDFRWLTHIFVNEDIRKSFCFAIVPLPTAGWKDFVRGLLLSVGLWPLAKWLKITLQIGFGRRKKLL